MSVLRWMLSFAAFPLGGLIAAAVFGSDRDPLVAFGAGLIVGVLLGAAQWLALGRRAGWRWFVATTVAVPIGAVLAGFATSAAGAPATLILGGALTGAFVGIAQGAALGRGIRITAIWTVTTAAAWAIGATISSLIIIETDRGLAAFGSAGALVATLVTGVVLRFILGPRARGIRRDPDSGRMMTAASTMITATTTATHDDA